jgi:S1-C subfamily serine protease
MGLGSGVMLSEGDIITNYHVIKVGVRYTVGRGKQSVPATFKGADEEKDLCLLTAPGLMAEPARMGKAARLKVGDPVYAVGTPQGLELSLSEGIVSQLRGGGAHPIIQTTVAISPGSSGGGLFNAKGELGGITTFYLKDGQSLNFALPVEWIGWIPTGIEQFDQPKNKGSNGNQAKGDWFGQACALEKANNWQGLVGHSRRWTKATSLLPMHDQVTAVRLSRRSSNYRSCDALTPKT